MKHCLKSPQWETKTMLIKTKSMLSKTGYLNLLIFFVLTWWIIHEFWEGDFQQYFWEIRWPKIDIKMQLLKNVSRPDWATSVLPIDSFVFLGIKRIFPKAIRWPTNFIQQQRYFNLWSHYSSQELTGLIAASISYKISSKQMGNFSLTQNSSKHMILDAI